MLMVSANSTFKITEITGTAAAMPVITLITSLFFASQDEGAVLQASDDVLVTLFVNT